MSETVECWWCAQHSCHHLFVVIPASKWRCKMTHTVRWQTVPEGISNTNRRPLHIVVRLCCTNYSHTHCCMASSSTHLLAAGQTILYSVCLSQGGHTLYLSCCQISDYLQNLNVFFNSDMMHLKWEVPQSDGKVLPCTAVMCCSRLPGLWLGL